MSMWGLVRGIVIWCTKDLSECTMSTGKFEEVRGKLSRSYKEVIFLDSSVSARCAFYMLGVQPPRYLSKFCFSVPVSQTPKYDNSYGFGSE